jgi:protoporphyrinogen/coproporphyrinogen III oxidase
VIMAPSRIWPVITTPILSPLGKLRMAWEYFVPAYAEHEDESLASFVIRRFGRETYERLVQPLVGGNLHGGSRAVERPDDDAAVRRHGTPTRQSDPGRLGSGRAQAEAAGQGQQRSSIQHVCRSARRHGQSGRGDRRPVAERQHPVRPPGDLGRPRPEGGWTIGVGRADGEVETITVDAVVLAVKAQAASQLLPGSSPPRRICWQKSRTPVAPSFRSVIAAIRLRTAWMDSGLSFRWWKTARSFRAVFPASSIPAALPKARC